MNVEQIREELMYKWHDKEFVIDKTGVPVVEIIGACFKVDENRIFGKPNQDYIKREIEWYESMSLNVNDIPGDTPQIWQQVSTDAGYINSNYGWCIFSEVNGDQFEKVYNELRQNPYSRRAVMIYNRPSMHDDYNTNGMSDFMCTNAVQYMIRDGRLNAVVQMRSNDAIFGFNNDLAWQQHILGKLASELEVEQGDIYWNAGSLHVYERHFYLIEHYCQTGELFITKAEYEDLYE